ncbi:MAG: large conductance mechanosensitive channel protein MscL [Gordonia sp. (in: high G+C Gram-positive bacteria)]|uniref:large conductance mechanosensitive channel protein MscL n=1 Tax=Gordonia sp. (in: high G+C Gram-positive bacteria) TaxID=84139 RepID=UPI003BB56D9E
MHKGFKEFIMRGNVVELATAVIIGAAFTAIVSAFTNKIVAPLLASIPTGGGCNQEMTLGEGSTQAAAVQVCGLATEIRAGHPETLVDFGAVIAAFINFVIVAAVVYFLIIVPYNKLNELAALRRGDDTEPAEATEIDVLTEIRDLLSGQRASSGAPAQAQAQAPQYAAPPPNPADGPGRHSR